MLFSYDLSPVLTWGFQHANDVSFDEGYRN